MTPFTGTIDLCIFCYKSILIYERPNKSSNTVEKFTKLLARFVNDKNNVLWTLISLFPSSKLKCCKDCENLVDSFCRIYHEIKCLELKLLLKLDTLMNVMKSADKVPSRVNTLKKSFQLELNKVEVTTNQDERLENFQILRKEIINKCKNK